MTVKKYKKTAIVEAMFLESFLDDHIDPVLEFCPFWNWRKVRGASMIAVLLKTREGELQVLPPCYIVKGIEGEFWPVAKEIFEMTYEEVADD